MRDPSRIPRILAIIERIWAKNPDLRLTQLIGNCFTHGDLYYKEDVDLENKLLITYESKPYTPFKPEKEEDA